MMSPRPGAASVPVTGVIVLVVVMVVLVVLSRHYGLIAATTAIAAATAIAGDTVRRILRPASSEDRPRSDPPDLIT